MSPDKEKVPASANQPGPIRQDEEATTGALTTVAAAILMLAAFTMIPGGTLQLVVVSLGGWMIGGAR
jgi:hypothetical protein